MVPSAFDEDHFLVTALVLLRFASYRRQEPNLGLYWRPFVAPMSPVAP